MAVWQAAGLWLRGLAGVAADWLAGCLADGFKASRTLLL